MQHWFSLNVTGIRCSALLFLTHLGTVVFIHANAILGQVKLSAVFMYMYTLVVYLSIWDAMSSMESSFMCSCIYIASDILGTQTSFSWLLCINAYLCCPVFYKHIPHTCCQSFINQLHSSYSFLLEPLPCDLVLAAIHLQSALFDVCCGAISLVLSPSFGCVFLLYTAWCTCSLEYTSSRAPLTLFVVCSLLCTFIVYIFYIHWLHRHCCGAAVHASVNCSHTVFIGYIITVVVRQCTQAWTAATRYFFD